MSTHKRRHDNTLRGCAHTGLSHSRPHPGITLIEVVVAVGIIATALLFLIPSLANAKAVGIQTRCLAHARSASQVVASYTIDWSDTWPYAGERLWYAEMPTGRFPLGGQWGLANGSWIAMFPNDWVAGEWPKSLLCPRDEPRRTGRLGVWLWMSGSLWLDPRSLAAGSLHANRRPKSNRVADTAYPSKKVVLFEQVAMCEISRKARYGQTIGGSTPDVPASTMLGDGSGRRTVRRKGLPAIDGLLPYSYTIDGIKGRDLE